MITGFKQILIREIKRFFKSKDLIIICLLAPILYSVGLTYIYHHQNPTDLKLTIIDKDNSYLSRNLVRMLDATPELNVVKFVPSAYEAYKSLFSNEAEIFYYIPEDFSENLKKSKSTFAFIGANASNFMVSSMAMKTIAVVSQTLSAKIFVKFLMSHNISKNTAVKMAQPLGCNFKWIFNPAKTYSNFFVPFILLAVFQQILIVAVCHTMSLETKENSWKDLFKISNNKILPVLLAKAVPYIFTSIFMIFLFLLFVLPFNSVFQTSKINFTVITFLYSFVIVFFAMAISHLFKTPVISLCALTFYSMPVLLISGFAWPLYMLPLYLKISAFLFPSTYFINLFRYYSLDNIPLNYSFIQMGQLFVFFLVCLLINLFFMKQKLKK
ncbi:ABC transporter permease [Candidatus Ruminimicrobium bovinum]|uniref:ABC transporter permease n=1 Tax=Candidatus Ruminimicrobium bovinum TaxID=3242779 RepID=UPI0039B8DDEE